MVASPTPRSRRARTVWTVNGRQPLARGQRRRRGPRIGGHQRRVAAVGGYPQRQRGPALASIARPTGAPPWGSPDPSRPTGAPLRGSPDPSRPTGAPLRGSPDPSGGGGRPSSQTWTSSAFVPYRTRTVAWA